MMSHDQAAERSVQHSPTILLVEDDSVHAELLTLLLGSETPYHVVCLERPTELFQRLDEVKAWQPALLMLDYLLPDMTAVELYDHLQQIEELSFLPTLILTASMREKVTEAMGARSIRVCQKPFDIEELVTTVKEMITEGQGVDDIPPA